MFYSEVLFAEAEEKAEQIENTSLGASAVIGGSENIIKIIESLKALRLEVAKPLSRT